MRGRKIQTLAGALEALMVLALAVNILAVVMTPAFVLTDPDHFLNGAWKMIEGLLRPDEDDVLAAGWAGLFLGWLFALPDLLTFREAETAGLMLFFGGCGLCTAVILRQARDILTSIRRGQPFRAENARAMARAAVCCWVIAGLALARCLWGLYRLGGTAPLFTRNALFIPLFFTGGLLCLVMSALFRQAAELKEDRDLTI